MASMVTSTPWCLFYCHGTNAGITTSQPALASLPVMTSLQPISHDVIRIINKQIWPAHFTWLSGIWRDVCAYKCQIWSNQHKPCDKQNCIHMTMPTLMMQTLSLTMSTPTCNCTWWTVLWTKSVKEVVNQELFWFYVTFIDDWYDFCQCWYHHINIMVSLIDNHFLNFYVTYVGS